MSDMFCPLCDNTFPLHISTCLDCDERLIALEGEPDLTGRKPDERYNVIEKIGEGGHGLAVPGRADHDRPARAPQNPQEITGRELE